MESGLEIKEATVVNQTGSAVRPKRLGKPSYMMPGSGVDRALGAISGTLKEVDNSASVDELPMDEERVAELSKQIVSPLPRNEVEATLPSVDGEKAEESLVDKNPVGPSRNKPKVVMAPAKPAPIKVKGEKNLEDTLYYNLRIGLDPEEVLLMETFCFELRLKVISRFRRKPAIGLQTLSQFFIKKMASDKAFARGIEDELITFFGTDKTVE